MDSAPSEAPRSEEKHDEPKTPSPQAPPEKELDDEPDPSLRAFAKEWRALASRLPVSKRRMLAIQIVGREADTGAILTDAVAVYMRKLEAAREASRLRRAAKAAAAAAEAP